MTKKQMIEAILQDMYKKRGLTTIAQIDKEYKGYLNSLRKAEVETIYNNRMELYK